MKRNTKRASQTRRRAPIRGQHRPEANARAIEYDLAVLDEIRRAAVDGFNRFGHGGLEIGGVLYGERDGEVVRILESVELESEHMRGPGFILSDNDRASLTGLLKKQDNSEVVGWYCSHTRTGIALSLADRELYDSFFPELWQVALVVKPERWGSARACFFFRTQEGGAQMICAANEFDVEPLEAAPEEPPSPAETLPAVVPATLPPAPVLAAEKPAGLSRWPRLAIAAALVAGAGLALIPARRPPQRLGLRAYELARQLRIEWDRNAPVVRDAASGFVEINDGDESTRVPIDRDQARAGSLTYVRRSGDVLIRMHIDAGRGDAAEELTRFVGQISDLPIDQVGQPGNVPPDSPSATRQPRVEEGVRPTVPRVAFVPDFRPAPAPEPPVLVPPPAIGSGEPTVSPPALIAGAASAAPPQPAPAPTPPVPAHPEPSSGRMIWSGLLGHDEVVEIEKGRATIGVVNGSLPGVAVALAFHPAEFRPQGVVAYTADPAGEKNEGPARANGWNATQFKFDPDRAAGLVAVETPNPSNRFNRLVLRNTGRNVPMILIDWRVLSQ